MDREGYPSKPFGFDLCTRIVFVHQAFSLAALTSGLTQTIARGNLIHILSTSAGLLIAIAAACAMFIVIRKKSLQALIFLRLILWIAVAKAAIGTFSVFGAGGSMATDSLRSMLLNEAVLIPLAIYWSRPVHREYLVSRNHCQQVQ